MTSHAVLLDIVAYFDSKTQSILKRYGPGPRVHYHTGIIDVPPPPDVSAPMLRDRLVAGQERMLRHAAEVWGASANLSGQILDVGCGLGGGAIYWAQEFGAQVTALTCVPSHAEWVAKIRCGGRRGTSGRAACLRCGRGARRKPLRRRGRGGQFRLSSKEGLVPAARFAAAAARLNLYHRLLSLSDAIRGAVQSSLAHPDRDYRRILGCGARSRIERRADHRRHGPNDAFLDDHAGADRSRIRKTTLQAILRRSGTRSHSKPIPWCETVRPMADFAMPC